MIKENLDSIETRIRMACERSGRDRSSVHLIAVTKTKPLEMLREAYDAGQRDFGENKVQEICRKKLDSYRLAETISAEAVKAQIVMPVLIEVNAAKEDSKYGVMPENTEELVRAVSGLPGIHVEGLMTIAPYTDDPETNRPYFVLLRQLAVDIDNKCIDNVSMGKLSMGMTGDFEVAIEEGATHIRVGTGIFGERIYT